MSREQRPRDFCKLGKNSPCHSWHTLPSPLCSATPPLPFTHSPTHCCCCPQMPGGTGSSRAAPALRQLAAQRPSSARNNGSGSSNRQVPLPISAPGLTENTQGGRAGKEGNLPAATAAVLGQTQLPTQPSWSLAEAALKLPHPQSSHRQWQWKGMRRGGCTTKHGGEVQEEEELFICFGYVKKGPWLLLLWLQWVN